MKKCMKLFTLLVVVCITLIGCASTKGTLYGADQREASKLPRWAGEGVAFVTSDAESYGSVILKDKGIYACGMSEDLGNARTTASAANLGARTALARFIGSEMVSAEKRITMQGKQTEFKQIDASMLTNLLVGTMIVDTFTDKETKDVYALAFISEENLKKSLASSDYTELADEILRNWENKN